MNAKALGIVALVLVAVVVGAGFFLYNLSKPTDDSGYPDDRQATAVPTFEYISTPLTMTLQISITEPGAITHVSFTTRDGGHGLVSCTYIATGGTVTAIKPQMGSYYVDVTVDYFNGLITTRVTKTFLVPISNPPKP